MIASDVHFSNIVEIGVPKNVLTYQRILNRVERLIEYLNVLYMKTSLIYFSEEFRMQ